MYDNKIQSAVQGRIVGLRFCHVIGDCIVLYGSGPVYVGEWDCKVLFTLIKVEKRYISIHHFCN